MGEQEEGRPQPGTAHLNNHRGSSHATTDHELVTFTRRVADLTPVFIAVPGGSEFARPGGWQDTKQSDSHTNLDMFRAGHAVCAVTGEPLAVVDVDPRNGGDTEKVRVLLAELGVRVFAEVATPGGGRHFYVAGHPDLPTSHDLTGWPGVDVQSHRANVFLPGTRRPTYDGGGYTVVYDNLGALADGGDPDGAEALVGWVAEHRTRPEVVPAPPSPPWNGEPPDARQAAYLTAVLRDEHDRVAAAAPGTRNPLLNRAAFNCGRYVAGAGMDEARVITTMIEAATGNGLLTEDGEEQTLATIRSGLRAGKQSPRAVPAPELSPVTVITGTTIDAATGEVLDEEPVSGRRLVLTPASAIKPKRVRWLWDGRLAVGTLGLLAGREGLGKSTLAYWLAAQVTRGLLPGEHHGTPKSILVCATEDSWEHTIVPRLIAADADLDRVFRVEVVTADDLHFGLSLPRDLVEVERSAREVDAALLGLDPLMSRLSETIDTHRDGDVRRALEPLVALAGRTRLAVLGLIHHNKSGSTDPLQLVMGSKAFTAVARSVHTVVPDPDDETGQRRLFGTPKNNLGRTDQPTLAFTIEGVPINTEDGTAWTARIEWGDELAENIEDTMRRALEPEATRTAVSEATDWLNDYIQSQGGVAPSADIKAAGRRAGHSVDSLHKARKKLKLWTKDEGFPRITYWGDAALADRDPPKA